MTKEILWRSPEREIEYRTGTIQPPTDLLNQFLTEHAGQPAKIFIDDTEPIDIIIVGNHAKKLLAVQHLTPNPDWILIPTSKIVAIACQN